MSNFAKCLEVILEHEGGYVNHPKDPGGETNLGITKRVYEEWGGIKDMSELTIHDVSPIYKKNYWDRCKCDDLPVGLDLCVFDFAVNAGTSRAAKYLQRMIRINDDGVIGPNTLKELQRYMDTHTIESMIKEYQFIRQDYYEGLKTFETFGRGWTRRVNETTDIALEMAHEVE